MNYDFHYITLHFTVLKFSKDLSKDTISRLNTNSFEIFNMEKELFPRLSKSLMRIKSEVFLNLSNKVNF